MVYLKSYKELIVWQKSIDLVREIYLLTSNFPKSELYCLVSQMRRCVVSIPSNIAEGYGRKTRKDFAQYLAISYGSALELETQLIIAKMLNYLKPDRFIKSEKLLNEVLKMLNSMVTKLRFTNLNAKR